MDAKRLLAVEINTLIAIRRELMKSCDKVRDEYDNFSRENKSRSAELLRACACRAPSGASFGLMTFVLARRQKVSGPDSATTDAVARSIRSTA